MHAVAEPTRAPSQPTSETARLGRFFADVFERKVRRSPMLQAYLGVKGSHDRWDDISEARAKEDRELARSDLARLRTEFRVEKLDHQAKLSYQLFERRLLDEIADFQWRLHSYPVNQMFGLHSQVPAFLANFHPIDSVADADAYISRLRRLPALFDQLQANLVAREHLGIMPPAFVFPLVLQDCRNIVTGAPFDGSGTDSPIYSDFIAKLDRLIGINEADRTRLRQAAIDALIESVGPAYRRLMSTLERQQSLATADDGVWKLPRGDQFYRRALAQTTTTRLTAEEIYALGLAEVERIHRDIQAIMKQVGFEGTLAEFFAFVRTDDRFYYPNTDEGRSEYQRRATEIIETMSERLDELFETKPRAAVIVKRVEPYRERSAGAAFYNPPSLDGTRPGIYYLNLYDMRNLPRHEMEALALHEGIPGHHMQNAIALERDDLPMFRRFGGYTAYGEGWGLYAERLGKELGFYQDPYADFGRLTMELWRACRLVVDTGIHHRRWTRERAIQWLEEHTPGSPGELRKAVDRYIVMPSQATAYTIGMLELLRLRDRARQDLGERFDLRAFHEVVLTNGPLPLDVLEHQIERWIAAAKG
jgi:uncharacterized protein (DUF885 family)